MPSSALTQHSSAKRPSRRAGEAAALRTPAAKASRRPSAEPAHSMPAASATKNNNNNNNNKKQKQKQKKKKKKKKKKKREEKTPSYDQIVNQMWSLLRCY